MHPRKAIRERVKALLDAAKPAGWEVSSTRVSAVSEKQLSGGYVTVATPSEAAARGGTCEAMDRSPTVQIAAYLPAADGIDDAADDAAAWIEPALWGDETAFDGVATDIGPPQTRIAQADRSERSVAILSIAFIAQTQQPIT